MRDLMQKLEEARELPPPGLANVDATIGRAKVRRRRRARIRAVTALAVIVLTGGGVAFKMTRPSGIELADGSHVQMRDSDLKVEMASPDVIELAMSRGRSRFDVVHRDGRQFRVHSGDVTVEVVGTVFAVERRGDAVDVSVERGRVRVVSSSGARYVSAGELASFAFAAPVVAAPTSPVPSEAAAPSSQPVLLAPVPLTDDARSSGQVKHRHASASPWRAAAARGDYDKAYDEIVKERETSVRDIPEELMLAADVARWSHHQRDAVPYLQRVVTEHASDPRAQLAAFTMGRVYLEELGSPREAAQAFAQARALNPTGPLAGDALAREVEAWSRADESGRAFDRAQEYLRIYPDGPRAANVRRFGKVE